MRFASILGATLLLLACGDGDEGSTAAPSKSADGPGGSVVPPPPPGPNPFDESALTSYRLTLDPADWEGMVADPFNDAWRRCTVEWQGEVYTDVAMQPAGNRSRIAGNPKPSFRLKFDEFVPDREFHSHSSIKMDSMIHDRAMMRARIEYRVYEMRGIPAPLYVHARMYVNGAYKGLYGIEERLKKEFLRKRFGRPVDQLYEWAASATMHDLLWAGPDPVTNYVPRMWIPEIEEVAPGAEGVRDLCYALNNDVAVLPGLFDVESFLNFIAVETLLGEGDQYVGGRDGTRSANIRMYRPPATGKYLLLPWDCDQGFWRTDMAITSAFENRLLTRNLILWNPANLERYKRNLRELIEGPYATSRMQARVDSVFDQIRAAGLEDPLKPYTNEQFEVGVQAIRSYIETRNAAFLSQVTVP